MNYTQCGSALALPYADGIAQTCVTSPPYYGLRDYGTARWEGGDAGCNHTHGGQVPQTKNLAASSSVSTGLRPGTDNSVCAKCGAKRIDSQIGLEQTPAAYVAQIVAAMREVWRVLRDDGTLWLNLGDSYAASGGGGHKDWHANPGLSRSAVKGVPPHSAGIAKPKDLMGIPWRVAFALQDDGWYLRSDIIWAKPNPMPESVTDRPTKAHEYVFLLAKQPRYFYDAEAIREENQGDGRKRGSRETMIKTTTGIPGGGKHNGFSDDKDYEHSGRNARSVWNIATQPFSGSHFATMPPELARRCILAGSSARGQCPKCGAPWVRQIERTDKEDTSARGSTFDGGKTGARDNGDRTQKGPRYTKEATGWAASCGCEAGDPVPQIVLDPFSGAGTTSLVASRLGRRSIGTELNPKYVALASDRVSSEAPLFLDSLPAYGTTGKAQPSYQSSLLGSEMGTL